MRATAAELDSYLSSARVRIDETLATALPPLGTQPAVLHEAMRYTLLLPGKRLRAVLVLACSEMLRGASERAMPLAVAVEMVHASSLILDDLPCMDDATLRRGRPALHRVVGEANAILASVALLNEAFARVLEAPLREPARQRAALRLAGAIGAEGLIGGQVADLEATGRTVDLDGLEFIHSHKTGALFIAAVELGGIAAGASARDIETLARYAKNLGLAFQITDDLLDYSGTPDTTGKDAGLDRDKTTFVGLCGIDGARRLVDDLVDAAVAPLSTFGRRAAVLRGIAEVVRDRDR